MIRYQKKIKKFLISENDRNNTLDCIEYQRIISNPCNRVLNSEQITETERLMNDKGILTSINEKTYKILEWEEEVI